MSLRKIDKRYVAFAAMSFFFAWRRAVDGDYWLNLMWLAFGVCSGFASFKQVKRD